MVLGAIERGGNVRLKLAARNDARDLHTFIRSKLAEETSLIITDEWGGYQGIADKDTHNATVSHFQHEYVRGIVHTNTLENVWSLFKRLSSAATIKYQ